jgi:8-oxo-dGTP pyrophosphatase MutT (NUDIX family)
MKLEIEVHPVQAEILKYLLFHTEGRFSDLNTTGMTNDQFTFHIKRLVSLGVLEKSGEKSYILTAIGKEFANKFDTDTLEIERQPKIGVNIVCSKVDNGVTYYLIQERLKQPYYGFFGFVTGKVRWGETILETATRELGEEVGVTADLKVLGLFHKMDYMEQSDNKEEKLLEDKFFLLIHGTNIKGEITEEFEGGRNLWIAKDEFLANPKRFHGVEINLEIVERGSLSFEERKYYVQTY